MTCELCGLESRNRPFCCAGCENVHRILTESGIVAPGQSFRDTELFQQSLKLGLISRPEEAPPPIPENAETREAVFQLSGMWCTSCGWLIEHALGRTRGVCSAEVIFASDLLRVRYAPQYLPQDRIAARVAALGYQAREYTGGADASSGARNDLLMRLGVAAFLWMNVMVFSLVVYASYFEDVTASFGRHVPFLLMALTTPAVFYCGAPILCIAWAGARAGALRMESLLSVGVLAAYGYSTAQAFAGSNRIYFDTVCAIVTLLLTGKVIERGAKEKAVRAITLLYRLMPNKARLLAGEQERFVSVEALEPGSVFRVKAGERIPADGVAVAGHSYADESVVTGESAPLPKGPGSPVISGSMNTGGVLDIRATRVGADSTLARVARAVEQATANRTHVERAVDRVARWFTPAVLAAAILTFAGWALATGRAGEALLHGISVLVIACPCALGIATPLALTAAVAAASKKGILVADARVLETIRGIQVVVLDKTGTVTTGEFALLDITGDTSRMDRLAAVEACSEHPLGRAVVQHVGRVPNLAVSGFAIHQGMGVSAVVEGTEYFLGSRRMADTLAGGTETHPDPETDEDAAPLTSAWFGWDGAVHGTMAFGDRVRPDAVELCAGLRRQGISTLLLSGDSERSTRAVAASIGADQWIADADPNRKIEVIRELQQRGIAVAMVGDGVNDAPSLAQADLGIALGSGTDIAVQAAPLVLMNSSLHGVLYLLDLSRRTFRVVRQNLFWAFAYNAAGIALAAAGVLNPILAACAMVLSSLSVIGNSRRLS